MHSGAMGGALPPEKQDEEEEEDFLEAHWLFFSDAFPYQFVIGQFLGKIKEEAEKKFHSQLSEDMTLFAWCLPES